MYQQEPQQQQTAYRSQTPSQQTYGQSQQTHGQSQQAHGQSRATQQAHGQPAYGQQPQGQFYSQPQGGQTQLPQFGQQGGLQQVPQQPSSQQVPQQPSSQQVPQQPSSQQLGQPSGQMQLEQQPTQFDASMSPEIRESIDTLNKVKEVGEWCGNLCIEEGQHMAQCARVCRDLSDLADLSTKLIDRNSAVGPAHISTFVGAAEQGLPELRRHDQQHVAEMRNAVERAIDSSHKVLNAVGWQAPRSQQPIQQPPTQQGPF